MDLIRCLKAACFQIEAPQGVTKYSVTATDITCVLQRVAGRSTPHNYNPITALNCQSVAVNKTWQVCASQNVRLKEEVYENDSLWHCDTIAVWKWTVDWLDMQCIQRGRRPCIYVAWYKVWSIDWLRARVCDYWSGYLNHIHRPENIIVVVHCIDLDSITEQGTLLWKENRLTGVCTLRSSATSISFFLWFVKSEMVIDRCQVCRTGTAEVQLIQYKHAHVCTAKLDSNKAIKWFWSLNTISLHDHY